MINPETIKAYRHGERIPDPFRGFLAVFYMPILQNQSGNGDNRPPEFIKTQPGGTDPGGKSEDGRRRFPGKIQLYHNGGNGTGAAWSVTA